MKKSLPCLPALAAFIVTGAAIAQSPPEPPRNSAQVPVSTSPESESAQFATGDRVLTQAIGQLERHASVSAKFLHQVSVGDQKLDGVLNYWQQGSGEDLKVRLGLQIVGQDAQLLQVCNSRFVWTDRKLPTGRNITRIDLRQLRADPSLVSGSLNEIKPGEANWSSFQSELANYTGGLPTLLTALNENFTFLRPQAMVLEPIKLPVYGVVGHWKPERLDALLAKTQIPADAHQLPAEPKHRVNKAIPERLPLEVLLLVRQADLFLYRLEYRRLETTEVLGNDGSAIPFQLSGHPMVVLQLSEVTFDAPIETGQFEYTPGEADWVDQTAAILSRLRQQRQARVATRPAADSPRPSLQ